MLGPLGVSGLAQTKQSMGGGTPIGAFHRLQPLALHHVVTVDRGVQCDSAGHQRGILTRLASLFHCVGESLALVAFNTSALFPSGARYHGPRQSPRETKTNPATSS